MTTPTMLSVSAAQEALKLYYLSGLRYQLNDKTSALLAEMEKGSEGVVGKEIVMALRYGMVGGIGNRPDTGALPKPNPRKTKQAKWETKNIFSRFRITDKTIQASKTNVGAFANLLQQEVEDCERDAKLNLSRQVLGDGTGKMATVTSSSNSGTTVTMVVDSTMYLAEGMYIDVLESDGSQRSADHEEVEITAILSDTQFTYTAKASSSPGESTDIVVIAGSHDEELTGLEAVIAEDTELYGIDRSENAYKWLNSNVTDLSGEIAEVKIQKEIDNVEKKSGSEIGFLFSSKGVKRAFQNLQTSMKQHVNTMDLKGGFTALSYNGMPLVGDKYVKQGRLYGLDLNDWKMYEMGDYDWLDKDGNMLRPVADHAAWEATLVKYCDIGCQRPRGQFLIHDITEH